MSKTLLQYAQENKQAYINACNAVIGRGGTVPNGMPASELKYAIESIPEGQTFAWQKVLSSTRKITVPEGVEPIAQFTKIGGMTHKTENLISFPYYIGGAGYTETTKGVTFTILEDGGIKVSGTSEGGITFILYLPTEEEALAKFQSGEKYTVSGGTAEISVFAHTTPIGTITSTSWIDARASAVTKALPEGHRFYRVVLYISASKTVDTVIYPIFVKGSEAKSYSLGFDGLRDSKVTSVKSESVNLLDISKGVNDNFVDNGDGTYAITNDGAGNIFSAIIPLFIPANHTVSVSGIKVSGEVETYLQFRTANGTWASSTAQIDGYTRKRTFDSDIVSARFYINSGADYEGKPVTIKNVQVEYGETATAYKPYSGFSNVTEIPEAMINTDGYGCGIEGFPNYIEYVDGKWYLVCNSLKLAFNGTEGWYAAYLGTENQFFVVDKLTAANNSSQVLKSALLSDYNATTVGSTSLGFGWQLYAQATTFLRIRPANASTKYPTLADWKAYLAERYANGNPMTFIYALAEPIRIDVSAVMTADNAILVEGGGPIEFVNEHGYDVMNEITYLIDTSKGD